MEIETKHLESLLFLARESSRFCVGPEGNISCKTSDDNFLIKSSGAFLSNIKHSDFTLCNFKLDYVGKKPSIEFSFHAWLLSNLDINYVAHTHPKNTLKILCSNRIQDFSNKRLFPDQVVFNGSKSCVVDYFHPGDELTNGIKDSINLFFEENKIYPKLILLKNHGIITMGKTVNECIVSTQICDKAAEIYLGCIDSQQTFLSELDIHKIMNDQNEKYRQKLISN